MASTKSTSVFLIALAMLVHHSVLTGVEATEEPMELQKDYGPNLSGVYGYGYMPFNAYSFPTVGDRVSMFRAMAYGGRGFHKKFDSLSGGTFGIQKRGISQFDI